MTAVDVDALEAALTEALRRHHPIMRSETGPFSGCRCGQVRIGQDVIAHVVSHLRTALDASPDPSPEPVAHNHTRFRNDAGPWSPCPVSCPAAGLLR